jgi:hypothetical protein
MDDELAWPVPEILAEQDPNGLSNPPAGILIENVIDAPDTVPEMEPRPVMPVLVSLMVAEPENDVPLSLTCHDRTPEPDESEAEPVHAPDRLDCPADGGVGWEGLDDPPSPPAQAGMAATASMARSARASFEISAKNFSLRARRSRRFICAPLQQELESKDSTPERAAIRDWITFRILDLLPDPVELHFHPAVHRPVHANREGLVAC